MIALVLLLYAAPPNSFGTRMARAQELAAAGRYEMAASELSQLAAMKPSDARVWYALGRAWVGAAGAAYSELFVRARQESAYAAAVQADGLMRRLQYRRAIAGFRAALSGDAALTSAHLALAEIYTKLGHADWAAEEKALNAAVDCGSHRVECDLVAGRYEAMLQATAHPATPAALYWRGQAATGLAQRAFQRLEQLPPSVELHKYRAGLHWEADRRLDVVKELRSAAKLAPAERGLRQELASALGAAGFYEEAGQMARALLRDAPDSPQLNALAGAALLSLQDAEASIPYLKKAVALEPRDLVVQSSLGRAYMDTGATELAVPYLEASASIDSDGSLHHLLATAYRRTGRGKEADEALAKYKELAARAAQPAAEMAITPP